MYPPDLEIEIQQNQPNPFPWETGDLSTWMGIRESIQHYTCNFTSER